MSTYVACGNVEATGLNPSSGPGGGVGSVPGLPNTGSGGQTALLLGIGVFAEQGVPQTRLVGGDLVAQFLVICQRLDKRKDQRDIIGRGQANVNVLVVGRHACILSHFNNGFS